MAMAMAAALRQTARRLGGSALQRPPRAAFYYTTTAGVLPQEQRLLCSPAIFRGGSAPTRPMSTSSSTSTTCTMPQHPRLLAQIHAENRVARIHDKKEELYDALLKLQRLRENRCGFFHRHVFISRDKELLVDLSELVRPKPDDISWRVEYRLLRSRLLRDWTMLIAEFIMLYLVYKFIRKLQAEDRRLF